MIFYKCLKGQFYQSHKTFTVWGLDSGSFRSWQQLQGQRGQMENLKTCSISSFICSIYNSNSPVVVLQRLARRPCGFPAADIPLFPVQTSPCIGPFLPASKLSGNFCLDWESIVVHYNWSKDVMSKVDHSSISVSGFWFHTYLRMPHRLHCVERVLSKKCNTRNKLQMHHLPLPLSWTDFTVTCHPGCQ